MSTNNSQPIYLVGEQMSKLRRFRLPSTRQVLRLFFYNHCTLKFTLHKSAVVTINEVCDCWSDCEIHVREKKTALSN